MERGKRFGEEDRVLRFALITVGVLFIIAAVVIAGRMKNLRADPTEGEKKLEQMAKADVQRTEARIQELERERVQKEENEDTQGNQGTDNNQDTEGNQDTEENQSTEENQNTKEEQDMERSQDTTKGYVSTGGRTPVGISIDSGALAEHAEAGIVFLFILLPVILALYYLVPGVLKNVILLIGGIIFYAWGEPVYIFIVLFSILFNYMSGLVIAGMLRNRKKAGRWLAVNIIVNLCMLLVFKYGAFLIGSVNDIFGTDIRYRELTLPIGISFYTLQVLSYTIDVYRRQVKVQKNLLDFAVYVTLFPRLIAGPVVKYEDIQEQLRLRKTTLEDFGDGVLFFIRGLAKILLLAGTAGKIASFVFALEAERVSALSAWLGCAAYMFRIYFQLGGCSDMAAGLGKMFGFEFERNFQYPYTAKSITDFWSRWYISLVIWFQNYVYAPLGGKRKSTEKDIRNILLIWMLIGLWHGTSWNFAAWGLYYGILLLIEKYILSDVIKRLPGVIGHIISLLLIMTGWVFFFTPTPGSAANYLRLMLGIGGNGFADGQGIYLLISNTVVWMFLILGSTPFVQKIYEHIIYSGRRSKMVMNTAIYAVLFFLCIAYLVTETYRPLMYF